MDIDCSKCKPCCFLEVKEKALSSRNREAGYIVSRFSVPCPIPKKCARKSNTGLPKKQPTMLPTTGQGFTDSSCSTFFQTHHVILVSLQDVCHGWLRTCSSSHVNQIPFLWWRRKKDKCHYQSVICLSPYVFSSPEKKEYIFCDFKILKN